MVRTRRRVAARVWCLLLTGGSMLLVAMSPLASYDLVVANHVGRAPGRAAGAA